MWISTLKALPLFLLGTTAAEIPANSDASRSPGILKYPITVSSASSIGGITRRQVSGGLANQIHGNFYTIEIEVGTPGQKVSLMFDSGSSELWVNPNCRNAVYPDICQQLGHFNSNQSSTFNDTGVKHVSSYGSGYVNLTYAYDIVSIGSAKISNQFFGVGFDSQPPSFGIMGGGPDNRGWDTPYPIFINSLVEQGVINSRAYGLDLRSIETQGGSLIFGGIDTGKFSGQLEKRPIIPAEQSPDGGTRFWIYLDGIAVSTANGSQVTAYDKVNGQAVLLDSGSSLSSLPGSIVEEIAKAFPPVQVEEGFYVVDCSILNSTATIDFKFGKTWIKARMADFILQLDATHCALGVRQNDQMPVLGDTFLRSAYVVFDFDNRNIHLANTADCDSNLVAIGKGPDAVPSVTGGCAKPTTTLATSITSTALTLTTSTQANNPTSSSGYSNSTTLVPSNITSTVTSTSIYTITSCASTVIGCPVGSVTTEIITSLTTYCPITASSTASPTETLTEPGCDSVSQPTAISSSYLGSGSPQASNGLQPTTGSVAPNPSLPPVTAGAVGQQFSGTMEIVVAALAAAAAAAF